MSRNNMHEINGLKLKKLIKKKGYTLSRACKELGLGDNNIGNWVRRNSIPGYGAKLIENEIGISLDEYLQTESDLEQTESEPIDIQPILNAFGELDLHLLMIYEELVRLNKELIGEKQEVTTND